MKDDPLRLYKARETVHTREKGRFQPWIEEKT